MTYCRVYSIFVLIAIAAIQTALAGCATSRPTPQPSFAVPWSGVYVRTAQSGAFSPASLFDPQVLLADGDVPISRAEKFVIGPLPLASVSAYSTYTYEAQPIGLPQGTGFRYRWVVQSGVSVP
jgi:hypothetical protein